MSDRVATRRRAVYDRWFGRTSVVLAWAGLVVALIHPPQGLGIRICMYWTSVGVPCPGCGLTRAVSSAAHGLFEQSWHFHPFGVPLLILFVMTAGLSVMPAPWRRRFAPGVIRHHRPANLAYIAFVIAFTTYGVARAIAHLLA